MKNPLFRIQAEIPLDVEENLRHSLSEGLFDKGGAL